MNDSLEKALKEMKSPETRPGFYEQLESLVEQQPQQPQKHKYLRIRYIAPPIFSAAAVVLVVALMVTSVTNKANPPSRVAGPTTTSSTAVNFNPQLASDVITKAEQTYATISGVSGDAAYTEYCDQTLSTDDSLECDTTKPAKGTSEFRLSSAGDYWQSNSYGGKLTGVEAYQSSTNRQTRLEYPNNESPEYTTSTNDMPVGAPNLLGHFSLDSLLYGLSLDQSAELASVFYDGRDGWSIHAKGLDTDALGISPDEVTAVFDKTTLLPISVAEKRHGKNYESTSVTNLVVDPKFGPTDFVVARPSGVTTVQNPVDYPWEVLSGVNAIAAKTSYQPVLPTFVPDGFTVTQVAFAKDAGFSGAEGLNPSNEETVMVTYGRGLQSLVFTTRKVGPKPQDWIDPNSFEGDQNSKSVKYVVKGGAYNDVSAEVVTGFGVTPHIWVVGSTLVTTVIGDASVDELQQILNSANRYGETK